MSKEVKLPSGARLLITVAPFADSRDLYQAIAEEMKGLRMDAKQEIDTNFLKDIFCTLLSSKKVESKLEKCMERVTYNGLKITSDTFEPISARDDYFIVCLEVAKENITPFLKSLYAQYAPIVEKLKGSLA